MPTLTLFPNNQFFDNSGNVLSSGLLYTYVTGTSTAKATYKDQAQAVAHANPVVLDSSGRVPSGGSIYLLTDAEYRFVLKSSDGATTYFTMDNVAGLLNQETKNIQVATNKGIYDDSGNEQLLFTKTTSAVNYANLTNSATGNAVTLAAKGDDTDITLNINSKGSGVVKVNGTTLSAVSHKGFKYGCTLSNNTTDATNDLDIAVGSATDTTYTVIMNLDTALVKRIDATWTAGTNQGMMASGVSLSVSTWYHVFLIQNTSGTVDITCDTSITCANGLAGSGYTYYRRIGSIYRNASGVIDQFVQFGDIFTWLVATNTTGVNQGTTAYTVTLRTPTGVKTQAHITAILQDTTSSANSFHLVSSFELTDVVPSQTNCNLAVANNGGSPMYASIDAWIMTNTSSGVRVRHDTSNSDITMYTNTHGWRELF